MLLFALYTNIALKLITHFQREITKIGLFRGWKVKGAGFRSLAPTC
jgi:hypothetical protein